MGEDELKTKANISKEECERVVKELREAGFSMFGVWTFAFTAKGTAHKSAGLPPFPVNWFTAKVHASTTEADWATMGKVCAAIGVPGPDKCEWPKTIETDANATHRWVW